MRIESVWDLTFLASWEKEDGTIDSQLVTWWSKSKKALETALGEYRLVEDSIIECPLIQKRNWDVLLLPLYREIKD